MQMFADARVYDVTNTDSLTVKVVCTSAVVGVNHVVTRGVIVTRLGETVVNHVTQFTCRPQQ